MGAVKVLKDAVNSPSIGLISVCLDQPPARTASPSMLAGLCELSSAGHVGRAVMSGAADVYLQCLGALWFGLAGLDPGVTPAGV